MSINLGTVGCCRQILRKRIGPFDSLHSLLEKHFTLRNVLLNIRLCERLLADDAGCRDPKTVKNTPQVPLDSLLDDNLVEIFGEKPSSEVVEDCLNVPWGRDY